MSRCRTCKSQLSDSLTTYSEIDANSESPDMAFGKSVADSLTTFTELNTQKKTLPADTLTTFTTQNNTLTTFTEAGDWRPATPGFGRGTVGFGKASGKTLRPSQNDLNSLTTFTTDYTNVPL